MRMDYEMYLRIRDAILKEQSEYRRAEDEKFKSGMQKALTIVQTEYAKFVKEDRENE